MSHHPNPTVPENLAQLQASATMAAKFTELKDEQ